MIDRDVYNKFARVAVCGQISIYGPNQVPKVDDFLPKTIYSSITIQGFYVGDYMVDSERGQSQVPDFYREVGYAVLPILL
jgi:NADPH-dependent curcumin reductase CurA